MTWWRTVWLAGWLGIVVACAHLVWRKRWVHRCWALAARAAGRLYPWLDRAGHGPALLLFAGVMLILSGLSAEVWWAGVLLGAGAALVVVSVEKREERRAAQAEAWVEVLVREVREAETAVREDVGKATAFLSVSVRDAVDEILDSPGL